jgi:hypothetical protein
MVEPLQKKNNRSPLLMEGLLQKKTLTIINGRAFTKNNRSPLLMEGSLQKINAHHY